MTRQPDLGGGSDKSCREENLLQPIRSDESSVWNFCSRFSETSFSGENIRVGVESGGVANLRTSVSSWVGWVQ